MTVKRPKSMLLHLVNVSRFVSRRSNEFTKCNTLRKTQPKMKAESSEYWGRHMPQQPNAVLPHLGCLKFDAPGTHPNPHGATRDTQPDATQHTNDPKASQDARTFPGGLPEILRRPSGQPRSSPWLHRDPQDPTGKPRRPVKHPWGCSVSRQ